MQYVEQNIAWNLEIECKTLEASARFIREALEARDYDALAIVARDVRSAANRISKAAEQIGN